jgi:hypothetical protein
MSEHSIHITVQRRTESGWLVVAEQTEIGDRLTRRHEAWVLPEEAHALFCRLLQLGADPAAYGTELGQVIIRGPIAQTWADALGQADVLHLLLTPEADEWQSLRWKWLRAAIDGQTDFLGLTQRTPISFYLPSASDRRFPPIGRDALRALVLVASPSDPAPGNRPGYDLSTFDGPGTSAAIRDGLATAEVTADVLAYDPVTGCPPPLAVGRPMLATLFETGRSSRSGPVRSLTIRL